MRRNLGLQEEDRALVVDSGGKEEGGHLSRPGPELPRLLRRRDRVQVHYAVIATGLLLHRYPVSDRA